MLHECLVTQMNHWVIVAAVITILGICQQEQVRIGLWVGCSVVPLLFYWFREKIGNILAFFLLHMCFFCIPFLWQGTTTESVLLFLILLFYIAASIRIRLAEPENTDVFFGGIFCMTSIGVMASVLGLFFREDWERYYQIAFFCVTGCYFLDYFTEHYRQFVTVNKNSASHIPERAMWHSGIAQIIGYLVGVYALLRLSSVKDWFFWIVTTVGNALLAVLRAVLSLVVIQETEELVKERVKETLDVQSRFGSGTEPYLFWEILEQVMYAAVKIFLAAVVVVIVTKAFRFVWEQFYKSKNKSEDILDSVQDIREQCEPRADKKRKKPLFGRFDSRQRIRKAYRSYILREKQRIIGEQDPAVLTYLTAGECCQRLSEGEVRRIYEKARYSREEIRADEVRKMKKKSTKHE